LKQRVEGDEVRLSFGGTVECSDEGGLVFSEFVDLRKEEGLFLGFIDPPSSS
jgi:hypothetical protein